MLAIFTSKDLKYTNYMNIQIKKTDFNGFGCKKTKQGLYLCCAMDYTASCGIVFYDSSFKEECRVEFSDELCYGNVFCVLINGIEELTIYRLFCDDKEYVDPYSTVCSITAEYGIPKSQNDLYSVINNKQFVKGFDKDRQLKIPYENNVIYLAHVRGLTMLDGNVKHKGTFAGVSEKISYFKELGINALMLMPCYEFIECEKVDFGFADISDYKFNPDKSPKINFWGFKSGFYFSPKQAYSSTDNSEYEFSDMVYKLHKAGIEVILMIYFTNDYSQEFINSVLRYYVINYHIDGFRLLGRDLDVQGFVKDPFLKDTKLIFDDNNLGRFYSDKPVKYKNLACMSSDFQDIARRFIKGDENTVSSMSYLFRENNKVFQPLRNISDYYGFSVNDLVTYNFKHNDANGEDNNDGNNFNHSWNCGVEGPTKKPSVNKLRMTIAKNAMLMTMLCQGTPVLRGGDEFLNTSEGNNNPWCMDNEIGWLKRNKNKSVKDFYEFTKSLISFRNRHTILHQPRELRLYDYLAVKLPDISFHSEAPFKMNQDPVSRSFAVLLCGEYAKTYAKEREESIYIIFNMYWETVKFALPVQGKDYDWYYLFSSDGSTLQDFDESKAKKYDKEYFDASGRSVSIFILRNKGINDK